MLKEKGMMTACRRESKVIIPKMIYEYEYVSDERMSRHRNKRKGQNKFRNF
jgi:hypothetical protein